MIKSLSKPLYLGVLGLQMAHQWPFQEIPYHLVLQHHLNRTLELCKLT